MSSYSLEVKKKTLKGIIICGAREGYIGNREHSLSDVLGMVDGINKDRKSKDLPIPSCMVSEAILMGRSRDEDYRERIYKFDFSLSPRAKPATVDTFYDTLVQYVDALGSQLKQVRVYLEFDGDTYVFSKNIVD